MLRYKYACKIEDTSVQDVLVINSEASASELQEHTEEMMVWTFSQ